jgi:hypothetical protein
MIGQGLILKILNILYHNAMIGQGVNIENNKYFIP